MSGAFAFSMPASPSLQSSYARACVPVLHTPRLNRLAVAGKERETSDSERKRRSSLALTRSSIRSPVDKSRPRLDCSAAAAAAAATAAAAAAAAKRRQNNGNAYLLG